MPIRHPRVSPRLVSIFSASQSPCPASGKTLRQLRIEDSISFKMLRRNISVGAPEARGKHVRNPAKQFFTVVLASHAHRSYRSAVCDADFSQRNRTISVRRSSSIGCAQGEYIFGW
jgi:hypothetical protein